MGLIISYLKRVGWGYSRGIRRYPYFKHIIQLLPGDWVKQVAKINEAVGEKNHLDKSVGKKGLVTPFRSK